MFRQPCEGAIRRENVRRALLPVFDRDGQECPSYGKGLHFSTLRTFTGVAVRVTSTNLIQSSMVPARPGWDLPISRSFASPHHHDSLNGRAFPQYWLNAGSTPGIRGYSTPGAEAERTPRIQYEYPAQPTETPPLRHRRNTRQHARWIASRDDGRGRADVRSAV